MRRDHRDPSHNRRAKAPQRYNPGMEPCDALISGRWCLPIAPDSTPIADGAVAFAGGRILAVGPAAELAEQYRPGSKIELKRHVLLPGLVNAHCHAAMSLLRGCAEDLDLQRWLNEVIWPLEGRVVNAEFVRIGADLAIAEMLSRGITCFADHYFFPEEAAACVDRVGLRTQIAFPITDFPNPWAANPDEGFRKGLKLHDAYREHRRISIAFGPHAPYSVSRPNLERILTLSSEMDRPVQIHLHENAAEVQEAKSRIGQSWVAELADIGLLNPALQAVHMTQLTSAEIELVARHGVQVVHCPHANMKLSCGACPLPELAAAGVNLALGTDGAASNNELDLFAAARLAALLTKHSSGDPKAGPVGRMLHMATLGGAKALGLEADIGSLEKGKYADLIAVDLSSPSFIPVRDPVAALIHGPSGSAVSHVWVAGRCLYEQGRYHSLDLEAVRGRANRHFAQLA